jgi:hypothetical protein
MDQPMTKIRLLELLQERRAAWDALLASVPEARMTEPGVTGDWSVKDIVAHLTYHERWYADRLHERTRGEQYRPTDLDQMPFEQRNPIIYERWRDRPLGEVLAESRRAFADLLAGVEAAPEPLLIETQVFEGAPAPIAVWQMLRGDVYEHYAAHMPDIQAWLAR